MKFRALIHAALLFTILLQSLAPVTTALAQEATPTQPGASPTQPGASPTATEPVETATAEPTATPAESPTPTPGTSPSVEPTATPTETPVEPTATTQPGASPTGGASPTLEPTASPSASPTATLPAPGGETLTLNLTANPAFAAPGGQVNLRWNIAPKRDMTGYQVAFFLGAGVQPAASEKGLLPAANGSYLVDASRKDPIKLAISAEAEAPFVVSGQLLKNGQAQSQALLEISQKHAIKAGQRQTVEGLNGRVKVTFGEGSLNRDVDVFVQKPLAASMPVYSLSGHPFEITAYAAQPAASLGLGGKLFSLAPVTNLEEITQFPEPVEIQVAYDETIYGDYEGDLHLYWYNAETQSWEASPSWVDTENNILYGYTDHFTVWDIDPTSWQASQVPTVDSFQVSEFTGAGSFSLPINVPPGIGGLTPELAASYSSQVIDMATSQTQASWLGMGWSLEMGSIERNINGTTNNYGDDTYSLNVGGVSSAIVWDGSAWRLGDENFWKISRVLVDDEYVWKVWDKKGTLYTFEKRVKMPWNSAQPCDKINWLPYRWMLTSITNIQGQTINYTYQEETSTVAVMDHTCRPYDTVSAVSAIYPDQITYANGAYRVRFNRTSRLDYDKSWTTDKVYHQFARERLSEIIIERSADLLPPGSPNPSGASFFRIRSYKFDYVANTDGRNLIWPGMTWPGTNGHTSTLSKVTEYAPGQVAGQVYNFTYGDNMHLTRVENRYGGAIDFAYESQPWYYGSAAHSRTVEDKIGRMTSDKYGTYNGSCWNNGFTGGWASYQVYSSAICQENGREVDDYLKVSGNVVNNSVAKYLFRPGGVYIITVMTASGDTVTPKIQTQGPNYNDDQLLTQYAQVLASSTNAGTTTATLYVSPSASKAAPHLLTTNGVVVPLTYFRLELLTAVYRVQQKRVYSDNALQQYFDYEYYGPAVNNSTYSSSLCSATDAQCFDYIEAKSQFRGHREVRVMSTATGLETRSFFERDDVLKGRMTSQVIYGSSGKRISETLINYVVSELPVTQPTRSSTTVYQGLLHNWVYQDWQENRTYTSNGTYYTATRQEYDFESSYGNLVGSRQLLCTGMGGNTQLFISTGAACPESGWQLRQKTITNYKPKPSPSNIVSLPTRVITYGSDGSTLLAKTEFLYDGASDWNVQPSTGVLTGQRVYSESNQYKQVMFGYDAWGNQTVMGTYGRVFSSTEQIGSAIPEGGGISNPFGGDVEVREVKTAYTANGLFPQSQTMPMDMTTQLEYDSRFGLPKKEIAPNGALTSAEYDAFGRLVKLWRPGDVASEPSITVSYHDETSYFWTEITQRIDDAQTFQMRRYYDNLGRQLQTRVVGAKVNGQIKDLVTDFYYDAAGRLWKQTVPYSVASGSSYSRPANPSQPVTTTTYDDLNRPLTVTAPDGSVVSTYAYDLYNPSYASLGLVNKVTDAKGRVSRNVVNALGQTVLVLPPTGPAIGYVYDNAGRMTKAIRAAESEVLGCLANPNETTCPASKTVSLAYNFAGQKTSMQDPDMGAWSYTYDVWGSLDTQTDARGCTLDLDYDPLNRLTSKESSGNCGAQVNTTYRYDEGPNVHFGMRTSMSDASGSTQWFYDQRGRMTREEKTITGSGTFTTEWDYNNANLPVSMTYPDGEIVTQSYNAQMMLESVRGQQGATTTDYLASTQYDDAGRVTERVLGSGLTQKYQYNPWTSTDGGKLQKMVTGNGAWNAANFSFTNNLQNLSYTYDEVGNIERITDEVANETQGYTYDDLNRLKSWTLNGTLQESYTYNGATGNLETKAGVTLYYANTDHAHAVSSTSSGNTYTYDANGSQTQRTVNGQTYNLGYDAENRLVSVSGPNNFSAQFTFDGDGKRVKSVIGAETIAFVNGYYEKKGNQITKYYPSGAMRRYTIPENMTLEYVLTDHLGSTSITTDSTGKKVSEIKYKPWGETRSTWTDTPAANLVSDSPINLGNTATLPYELTKKTFTGQYSYVSDFGLHFYNARWYDSALGRFAQADTIIPGGAQGLDRYAYVNNNPVMLVDPSGHLADCSAIASASAQALCIKSNEKLKRYDDIWKNFDEEMGISFNGTWKDDEKQSVRMAVWKISIKLSILTGEDPAAIFKRMFANNDQNPYGKFSFERSGNGQNGTGSAVGASFGNDADITVRFVIHELGHSFDKILKWPGMRALMAASIKTRDGAWVTGKHIVEGVDVWERGTDGYPNSSGNYGVPDLYHGPGNWKDWNKNYNDKGEFTGTAYHEEWADMFMNWVDGSFVGNAGTARNQWMTSQITSFLVK